MTQDELNKYHAALFNAVSVPAFFAKLAADTGASPRSDDQAMAWALLAEKVSYVTALTYETLYSPRAALDEAAKAAHVETQTKPRQPPPAVPTVADFLKNPAVKAAADVLAGLSVPAASQPTSPPPAAAPVAAAGEAASGGPK